MNEYTISIERRPHYLYVAVTGENTAATIERYMKEISEACRRLGMLKVLVVGNLQGPGVDMLELYKVVTTASDEAIGSGIRAAYVELNPARSDANMQMAENAATTRGIPVHTFRNIADAEAWLLSVPHA